MRKYTLVMLNILYLFVGYFLTYFLEIKALIKSQYKIIIKALIFVLNIFVTNLQHL